MQSVSSSTIMAFVPCSDPAACTSWKAIFTSRWSAVRNGVDDPPGANAFSVRPSRTPASYCSISSRSSVHDHLEVETAARHTLSEIAAVVRLVHRPFQDRPRPHELTPRVHERRVAVHRVRADDQPFEELVRVPFDQFPVVERAGLA